MRNRLPAIAIAILTALAPPTVHAEVVDAPPGASQVAIDAFNAGIELSNAQKYAEAADKFAAVCKEVPKFAEAQSMYGFCLLRTGHMAEADAALAKAYELNPKLGVTLMNWAGVKQTEGQLPAAIDLLNQFLKVEPTGDRASKARAMLESLHGEVARRAKVESSVGKPNYFSEATAPGIARWSAADMPIKVFIAPATGVKNYRKEFRDSLEAAFTQWAEASDGAITVSFVDTPPTNGINCSFIDDPTQLRNSMEGGEAVISVDPSGIIKKATVKISTQTSGTGTPDEDAMVKNMCLHEVGHALGMRAHSSDNHDVMFGFRTSPLLTALSERDKATLRKLYTHQHTEADR